MEIEKKFLAGNIPFLLSDYKKIEIKQGYISTDPVIRIRKSNDNYYLTVKGKGKMVRHEYELDLSREQFDKLSVKVETNYINKTRYVIPIDETLNAELDIYHDNLEGLITIEVEFPSVEEAINFKPPKWFGIDVTNDIKYQNNNLSKLNPL